MKRMYALLEAIERKLTPVDVPERFAGKIRAFQQAEFTQMLPVGLVASSINASVILLFFFFAGAGKIVWMWGALIGLVSIGAGHTDSSIKMRGKDKSELPEKVLNQSVWDTAIFGYAWGVAPALLLPVADLWPLSVVLTVSAGMMAGGAYILSAIPRASALFVLSMMFGLCVGLVRGGVEPEEWALAALFAVYTPVLIITAYWNFGSQVRSWSQQIELAEQATEVSEQKETISLLLKEFEENASDFLWEMDANGRLQNVSEALAEFAKISMADLTSKSMFELIEPAIQASSGEFDELIQHYENRRGFTNGLVPMLIDGETRWWSVTGKPLFDKHDVFQGYRGVVSDITEARNAEARIAYLAHFDSLTDLPNRSNFNETMERCFYRYKTDGSPFAVIFVDLDLFKVVNDEHGHDVGDELLKSVSETLRACAGENDVVARIGGDEFAIICQDAKSRRSVMALCDRITESFKTPIAVQNVSLRMGVSLGCSLCPSDADTMSELLKCADLALYRAKADGRGLTRFFEASMDIEARERRKLEQELQTAFTNGQFVLYYQPLVSSETRETEAFETLLRWQHPKRGMVSPEVFINLTEQSGMIISIGEWVIRTALAEAATWDTNAKVSINLSPIQVKNHGLVSVVTNALATTGIDPDRVEFEITESVLLDYSDESMDRLHRLRSLGVHIALDDFGTGYSSLSYLRAFPFEKIKIDKSFVQEMQHSSECQSIVRAVVELAKSLGMRSTAEGVELIEQVDQLTEYGCTELQGYYFSRPKTADDLVKDGFIKRLEKPKRRDRNAPLRPANDDTKISSTG